MMDPMLTLLKKDFVRTHENMTDYFASIGPLHPALFESNKPLFEQIWSRDEQQLSEENEVFRDGNQGC